MNRRVSLTVFGQDVPETSAFPCQTGDVGACAIDDHAAHRCVFFRQHIGVHEKEEHGLTFWDHQWVRTPSGAAHMSMLTSAPDSDEVELTVFLWSGRAR